MCRKTFDEDRIEWAAIFGVETIPLEASQVIADAVETMVRRNEVSPKARWQFVEFMAAQYLAEVGAED